MTTTNTLCSTSCSSTSVLPEPGFYLCTIKTGETYVIDTDETNRLLFLLDGSFLISSAEYHNYPVSKSHLVFCSRDYSYTIEAESDCTILIARFVTGCVSGEGETYRSIATEVAKISYKFSAIPMVDIMQGFAESVMFYLNNDVNSVLMHRAKIEEMFVIFRHFYPREMYLRTFYTLFNNNMSFRTLVINNAPNAKNVEQLARMCGHSLSHFKLLFSQNFDVTPYVWMQQQRAIEISRLLHDTTMPLKGIIKKYGFTSHGHFSLFCRKFLGDTPRTLRRRSHLTTTQDVTIDDVKRNLDRSRRQSRALAKKNAPDGVSVAPRKRGRPRKVQA